MTKTPQAITTDFITSFMSGEISKARGMVTNDFCFEAPLYRGRGDASAYFAGAQDKAKCFRGVVIRRQCAQGDEVATLYDLHIETSAGSAVQTMSEWHTIRDGQVASIVMMFDSGAPAVGLLRQALMSKHI